jgi:hypothetical protein
MIERFEPTLEKARLEAMAIATRHNVAVYPVDAMGLTTETSGPPSEFRTDAPPPGFEIRRMSALRAVAEDTGASAVVGTNNFAGGYSRIVAENSTYYILGYAPADERQDGKFHGIRVRVKNRPELIVHARRGYTAPDANAKPAALPPLPNGVSEATRDALRSPAPVTGIGIDLVTAVYKGAGKEGSVVLDAQLRGAGIQLNSGERVTVSYQAIDTDGKIVTGAYKAFTLDLRDTSRKDVLAEGLRFVDRVTLPPGRYEIRFVADQPSADTLGSIVTHVDVPEFNAPLTMSGVLIASLSTSGHRTLMGDDIVRKALSAEPTAVRRFPQSDELAIYVELYPAADARLAADGLGVTATVLTRDSAVSLSEEATALMPADGTSGIPFRAQVSLSDLSPGTYVLRVEGRASPEDETPLRRHIPFTVVAD